MPTAIDPNALLTRAQADGELGHRFRKLTATIALPFLDPPLDLAIDDGRVMSVAPLSGQATVVFDGPAEFWQGALTNDYEPGFESLTEGFIKGVRPVGLSPQQAAAYHGAFGRLLEVLRDAVNDNAPRALAAEPFEDTDTAVGRYVHVSANGKRARIYYEEAGEGDIVILMQHTAGGDSRQYRHQLADPELQKRCRLIAYDLPFHGRSLPPTGERWWEQNYHTSKDDLMGWIVGLVEALKLDRPIFMGCSVGGNLALDLAAEHGDKFRAFISVNGWYAIVPSPSWNNEFLRDPNISPDLYSTMCLGSTAPLAPDNFRYEVYWNYRSNFPGVYAGDNDYFMHGHDLRTNGHTMRPDLTPVYVLVGEYDHSAHDDEFGGRAVERNIPGTIYREMKGLGHFAPTDDPMGFRKELIPVVDEILETVAEHG